MHSKTTEGANVASRSAAAALGSAAAIQEVMPPPGEVLPAHRKCYRHTGSAAVTLIVPLSHGKCCCSTESAAVAP